MLAMFLLWKIKALQYEISQLLHIIDELNLSLDVYKFKSYWNII